MIDLQFSQKSDITQECHTRWILVDVTTWQVLWLSLCNSSLCTEAVFCEYICVPTYYAFPQWEEYNDTVPVLCDWDGRPVVLSMFCMCAYIPRVLREHIVTLVVFSHQRPCWQRLKWWLRTEGLDGKMWINEAQIELIAMTSLSSAAAKWEYVEGPPESQCLFPFQGGRVKKENLHLSADLLTCPGRTTERISVVFIPTQYP